MSSYVIPLFLSPSFSCSLPFSLSLALSFIVSVSRSFSCSFSLSLFTVYTVLSLFLFHFLALFHVLPPSISLLLFCYLFFSRPLSECAGCKEEITHGQSLLALEKQWHVTCFKCQTCGTVLTGEYISKYALLLKHYQCQWWLLESYLMHLDTLFRSNVSHEDVCSQIYIEYDTIMGSIYRCNFYFFTIAHYIIPPPLLF